MNYSASKGSIGGTITGCDKVQLGEGNKPNWDGLMDEVRVCSLPRSDDWIQASYSNQVAGSTFNAYGDVHGTGGMLLIVR